ncbi:MAG TPA: CRTAC1 family protein [Pyrinomonadaceae bacterium]|nr:CRTAC1 family protein [Pyrinomonadaceae bacterium]
MKNGPASTKIFLTAVVVALCLAPLKVDGQPGAKSSSQADAASATVFEEVAEKTGLSFRHYNGANGKLHLPEVMGAGAALFDFDSDGDLDLYLVQGSALSPDEDPRRTKFPWREPTPPRGRLFRNDLERGADGRPRLKFTDVTERSRLRAEGYGMGAASGDVNNDGRPDLYLTNLGPNQLYLNNGDGTFTDATERAGADDRRWSTGASFVDYDRDGWLDLMVINYADFDAAKSPACYSETTVRDYCGPRSFRAVGNRLLRNRGDGRFEDVTERAGVAREFGHALGVVAADFDGDGWPDLYVANDGDPNQLWLNRHDGTFKNSAWLAGAAVNRDGVAEAGMGVDAGDFDASGTEDIFVTHLMEETHTLYVNAGGASFEDRTRESGLGLPGSRLTGFGTLFFDYDNDGWLDLLVANGAVRLLPELVRRGDPYPLGQPNQLFRNDGAGKFVETSEGAGAEFRLSEVSRGAAFGDVDNDGDTDVLVTNNNGPVRLFLNRAGNRNHWLGLRLVGRSAGRDMLGASVEVVVAPKRVLMRRARTDGSYLTSQDPRVLVGLGRAERVESVRVRWPGGAVEEWKSPPIDRYVTLKEGESAAKK